MGRPKANPNLPEYMVEVGSAYKIKRPIPEHAWSEFPELKGKARIKVVSLGTDEKSAKRRFLSEIEAIYEGMPIAFIESLSAGTPIVSTDIGGADEAIVEGETGYVAKSMDAAALAASCAAFLNLSDAERDTMKVRVKQRSELFTSEAMAENAMKLYRSLLPAATV